ncbi:MAG: DNA repair protein RecO [Coriobacteriales bacterium]|jgi:recombinational DNA repair protein (RecF pathway)|nr:DNA repair protein RecO [Coriobacteriales bacterium]
MPSYGAEALVLKKTKLGETDTVFTLLTTDGRQIRAVAKAARKPGSSLGARLEPGYLVEVRLHTGRSLEVISEVRLREPNRASFVDLEHTAAVSVVLELAEKSTRDFNAEPMVFNMSVEALRCIGLAQGAASALIAAAALLKLSAALGFRPTLAEAPLPATIDPAWLERLLTTHFADLVDASAQPYDSVAATLLCFARNWLVQHLEIRLKSLDVLLSLWE